MVHTVWKHSLIFCVCAVTNYFQMMMIRREHTLSQGFRASLLHCPPQNCQSSTMGQDCTTDSARCRHLWLFPPELTVWTSLYIIDYERIAHLNSDKQFVLWLLTLTSSPPKFNSDWLVCEFVCECESEASCKAFHFGQQQVICCEKVPIDLLKRSLILLPSMEKQLLDFYIIHLFYMYIWVTVYVLKCFYTSLFYETVIFSTLLVALLQITQQFIYARILSSNK